MSTVADDLKAQAEKAVQQAAAALEAQAAAQTASVQTKLQAAALSLKADANAELVIAKGKLDRALASKPKTVVVIALIVGFVAGVIFATIAGHSQVQASGATASHESYSAAPRSTWHDFVPFVPSGVQGNG